MANATGEFALGAGGLKFEFPFGEEERDEFWRLYASIGVPFTVLLVASVFVCWCVRAPLLRWMLTATTSSAAVA